MVYRNFRIWFLDSAIIISFVVRRGFTCMELLFCKIECKVIIVGFEVRSFFFNVKFFIV